MCCHSSVTLGLPAPVIEALARYRHLQSQRGWDWGDDRIDLFRWARFARLGPIIESFMDSGDWGAAVRSVIARDLPPGSVVVRVDRHRELRAEVGPPRLSIAGRTVPIEVVIDSAAESELVVKVAGRDVHVPPRGVSGEIIELAGTEPAITVELDDRILAVNGLTRTCARAELRLISPVCARWSVTDGSGGAWFADGVLAKWDVHQRPFFHGHDLSVAVPAEQLDIVCTRGIEFARTELEVHPQSGETRLVECDPQRLFDPAADGWYGGDLHVHMNYSGDLVCAPADAARMQLGEGLHLANFVAANSQTSLVYDREMLDQFAGVDLPWAAPGTLARMGVEYRNDLLGHVHALGPKSPPRTYYSGFERSDHPHDWPPNRVACRELRELDATVGYAHPSFTDFGNFGSTEDFFRSPRSVEARELVADAALGVVDSVDIISPFNDEGALFLYYKLLSCGIRLAATAGTDTFLSFSRLGTASNPPGWGRVYAELDGQPLSVAAFKDAIRAGRTIVTNGPWLALQVNGRGPGSVLDATPGTRLDIQATVSGPGAEHLWLVGPDGVLADGDAKSDLRIGGVPVESPTWIAAVARGPGHPNTLDRSVLAHTSPVYVDVGGRRVARRAAAQWCLDLLDTLQDFAGRHALFDERRRSSQWGDLVATLDEARVFYRGVFESADR